MGGAHKNFCEAPRQSARQRPAVASTSAAHHPSRAIPLSWESSAFPTQRNRAAQLLWRRCLVPLTDLGLPPDVVPRSGFGERRPYGQGRLRRLRALP